MGLFTLNVNFNEIISDVFFGAMKALGGGIRLLGGILESAIFGKTQNIEQGFKDIFEGLFTILGFENVEKNQEASIKGKITTNAEIPEKLALELIKRGYGDYIEFDGNKYRAKYEFSYNYSQSVGVTIPIPFNGWTDIRI